MPVLADDKLLACLRDRFGHAGFRAGQRDVIETVVAGGDTVVVMPTGGGKSLCYQLPAVFDGATTIVVSPLIALMKDQVDALRRIGIAAADLHSSLTFEEQRDVERAYSAGALSLLYVAPERLVRPDLRALLAARPPARIVVDEAHCISEWGHDFRRDYLRIGEVVEALRPVQVIACTATATPEVREDIASRLGLGACRSYVHGFDRPNLHFAAERCRDEAAKLLRLDELLDPGTGRAIVYAGTRARATALADRLARRFPTMLYHGSLRPEQRIAAQERFFMGEARVAVTTSAFGMGVDLPDVRQVVHVALPGSLEEYYQQAGRAGRDGLPSRCTILHTPADRRLQEYFIESANPEPVSIAAVYVSLRRQGRDPGSWRGVTAVGKIAAGLSDAAGDAARELLRHHGVIGGQGEIMEHDPSRLPVDYARMAVQRRLAYRRLDQLTAYLRGKDCRHHLVLDHFGEDTEGLVCGGCDVCAGPGDPAMRGVTTLDPTVVRKALSAVARLNGRVGIAKVAGVLHGSRNKGVLSIAGATRLSTFGLLGTWREADVTELLRRLLDAGLLVQGAPPYATVALTPAGVAVMRGDEQVPVGDPRAAHGRGSAGPVPTLPGDASVALDAESRGRFEQLRAWRAGVARERSVPAYVVLPDRTLAALASVPPASPDALLEIPGIGPVKAELYGSDLLALLGRPSGNGQVA